MSIEIKRIYLLLYPTIKITTPNRVGVWQLYMTLPNKIENLEFVLKINFNVN